MNLESSVQHIKGIGPETARKFEKLGVKTVYDLLTFWPKRYEDYSEVLLIKDVKPGTITVKAQIESIKTKHVRRGMHITEAVIRDESSAIRVVWFNQPYREKYFKSGTSYYFSGLYDFSFNRYVLQNPAVEQAKDFTTNTARIVPIYAQTKGLDSRQIRNALAEVTSMFQELPESLPDFAVSDHSLMSFPEAALQMHWPEDQAQLKKAKKRIGFEEIFAYVLAGQLNKKEAANENALAIEFNKDFAKEYTNALSFKLTDAQKRSAWEILQDVEKSHPMNRLLEGDVGSGKTVVAAFVAYMAAKQGIQTAFMAPTELLAQQHAKTLGDLLEPLGVTIGLLTGSARSAAKSVLKEHVRSGDIKVVIGTHALLHDSVSFHRLGFIVIDEQHRFGVKQRQALVSKGKLIPHILSMTATPIPRSLALTVYGDLEISILDQKPSSRLPVETNIWSQNSKPQLYKLIDEQIQAGHQVFVICPLIDDSKDSEVKSVNEEAKRLMQGYFKHRKVGTLHGKMKEVEKSEIMERFAQGQLDILVSTTVIEVGIDIPNASVMLIEGADSFGLAQLHQLRGRVGRGEAQSYCYLVPSTSAKPSKRLRAMESSQDGFKLAQMDLELRGPGAIYGKRQHGTLDLKIAEITDVKLTKDAQQSAQKFITEDISFDQFPILKNRVDECLNVTILN